jgi:hypothetical protein
MAALTACVRRLIRFLARRSEPAQREKGSSLWNKFPSGVITAQSGDIKHSQKRLFMGKKETSL